MDYDYVFIHEEADKLLKQCNEVKTEINEKRTLELCEDLNRDFSDIRSNGYRLGNLAFSELTDDDSCLMDTSIDPQHVEWRKLADGMNAFLEMIGRSDYNERFQAIVDSSGGGVTDRTVGDTEVLVNKIDNDLKVELVKKLKGR